MSIKIIDSGKKGNENLEKRILQRQSETPKHFVFPKPETLLLSDKSEFPSLSESLGRDSNYLPSSGGSLKYSDKLKSSSSSKSHVPMSYTTHFKCNSDINSAHQCNNITRPKDSKNKLDVNSKQNIPKRMSDHFSNKSVSSNNDKKHLEKKELTNQKPVLKPKLSIQNASIKSSNFSNNANMLAKLNNQSNKSATVENGESKEENSTTQDSSKTKKKKNRKSKVKRQVALQSGKITFLTPEVHSKILNQASTLNTQNSLKNSVIGNINDEKEYPELGKTVLAMCQKENFPKKNVSSEYQIEAADESVDSCTERNAISEKILKESGEITTSEKVVVEKREKNDKVHSHNPITISFYDMLLKKNAIKEIKEFKSETESSNVIGLSKLKNKKNASHPHNLLDSSSPAVKRGKEREKPKPKKPSQLKKIILLDRKARREHLLQLKTSFEEENTSGNELMSQTHIDENNRMILERDDQNENNFDIDLLVSCEEDDEDNETVLQLTESTDFCVQDELISETVHLSISEEINSCNISDLSSNFQGIIEKENFIEKSNSTLFLSETPITEKDSRIASQANIEPNIDTKGILNVLPSPELSLNSFIENLKPDISDKEKAVKILLHTRNFREYCNHLISKDIDDATYALLEDLARFQDRLHQKDPVKARIKKRMIYGVKEVKKHIKLRKLKCIIMAVDIENVEAQGGLNDILNEIKVSAVDHHIPYVFALSRKLLGKVCRKPVPVSCVGVFNYEGSEANFKKMVELQSQSKADYTEIFNKLLMKVTDEEVAMLIKAKKEAPETLRTVRGNILSNFFVPVDSIKSEDENIGSESNDTMSTLINMPT